jgi:hypothetical protein
VLLGPFRKGCFAEFLLPFDGMIKESFRESVDLKESETHSESKRTKTPS